MVKISDLINLWGDTGRGIVSDDTTETVEFKNTSTGHGARIESTSGAGVAVKSLAAKPAIDAYVSGTSGTVMKISNIEQGYVSTNSAASLSYAIRVDIGGTIYYMPVYLAAA